MLVAPSSVCPTPREAMFVRMTAASWEALSPSMHALNEVLGMVNYDPDEEDVLTDTPLRRLLLLRLRIIAAPTHAGKRLPLPCIARCTDCIFFVAPSPPRQRRRAWGERVW